MTDETSGEARGPVTRLVRHSAPPGPAKPGSVPAPWRPIVRLCKRGAPNFGGGRGPPAYGSNESTDEPDVSFPTVKFDDATIICHQRQTIRSMNLPNYIMSTQLSTEQIRVVTFLPKSSGKSQGRWADQVCSFSRWSTILQIPSSRQPRGHTPIVTPKPAQGQKTEPSKTYNAEDLLRATAIR